MKVPLLDLKPQYRALKRDIDAAIEAVSESQHFILGPAVKQLEADVAAYCGTQFGIGVSSGTDALLVALMVLDIGPGDEVITSPYTFFATGGTIARAGARPVYCDIDATTFNLSPAAVERFIARECETRGGKLVNKRTNGVVKALMPVHLYGQVADMDRPMPKVAAPVPSATSAACHFSRPRISAPSAMPACASQTMRRLPSGCGSSACTAGSRSTTTRSSAAISGSMNCRPRC